MEPIATDMPLAEDSRKLPVELAELSLA